MQTNEIFLLVGEVLAQIASTFFSKGPRPRAEDKDTADTSSGGGDTDRDKLAAARAPFADFVQEPWWDVAVPRDSDSDPEDGTYGRAVGAAAVDADAVAVAASSSLPDTLRALCEESSTLLRSAFAVALGPLPAPLERALGAERFGRVVGMFEQNNVGVRAPSPIPGVVRELLAEGAEEGGSVGVLPNRGAAGREVLREAAGLVLELMEEEEDCEDEDERKVVSKCCGGPSEGAEGHDDGHGCRASTARGVSEGDERVAEAAHRTDCAPAASASSAMSAPAPARGVGESDDEEEEDDTLEVLRSAVDGEEGDHGENLFAPLDGTALYSLVCCMNHSCRPNCVVRYPGRRQRQQRRGDGSGSRDGDQDGGGIAADPLVAEVVLLEDVAAGDELTQSYVTREMGVAERRKALEDYGFLCACPRCLEEAAEAEAAALS